jgi:hypothetical protein
LNWVEKIFQFRSIENSSNAAHPEFRKAVAMALIVN